MVEWLVTFSDGRMLVVKTLKNNRRHAIKQAQDRVKDDIVVVECLYVRS